MCTAATYTTDSFYFGRNLDYEFSYGDEVTVTPRAYPFSLRCMGDFRTKYAMIGMAYVAGEYPLYYDAVNEKGLGIAGLNFVGNAVYHPAQDGKSNVAQFELIPWMLGSCATLAEVRTLLAKTNIVNIPFSEQLPLAQLHWLIADKTGSIVVESTADGLHIYDNPVGVLTNNPPFPQQLFALNNYRALSPRTPAVAFADGLDLPVYSRGLVYTSFCSSWESVSAVNDGIVRSNSYDPSKPRYGTWGNTSAYETVTYTWAADVIIDSTDLYLWYDGTEGEYTSGGILVPKSVEFEYLDAEFTDARCIAMLDHVSIYADGRMVYSFLNGSDITVML